MEGKEKMRDKLKGGGLKTVGEREYGEDRTYEVVQTESKEWI